MSHRILALLAPLALGACADLGFPDPASFPDVPGGYEIPAGYEIPGAPDPIEQEPADGAPYAGRTLYVDPTTTYSAQAEVFRKDQPWNAALMDAMAAQPTSLWIGDWTRDVAGTVDALVSTAGSDLTTLVVYNIPYRDCGNWSAGGAADVDAYDDFIADIADGLNGREAIVVLEPDGLPLMDCLSDDQIAERLQLMSDAVDTLTDAGGLVYIDAGDSAWEPADLIAERLAGANVARAAGFSLNVSHTEYTTDEIGYANELRAILGDDEHFIVDTGRNGNGPDATHEWCNPRGRATGDLPTLRTGDVPGLDAKLWIKPPGDSDGSCGGGPEAGHFWPEYAIELATLGGL